MREVFDEVVSLPPGERDTRLAHLSVDDPGLRREVESLLSHDSVSQDDDLASIVGRAAVAVTADKTALHAGQALLHYTLTTKIGQSGMGVVWRATDRTLGRTVAIKVLPSVGTNGLRLGRFEREAKLLAVLNHPNIAAIYSIHDQDGVRFLAMEYRIDSCSCSTSSTSCDRSRQPRTDKRRDDGDACPHRRL